MPRPPTMAQIGTAQSDGPNKARTIKGTATRTTILTYLTRGGPSDGCQPGGASGGRPRLAGTNIQSTVRLTRASVATTSPGTRHHVPMGPADALNDLVDRLHASEEPDFDLIAEIGCGDLENLVRGHGDELWPEISGWLGRSGLPSCPPLRMGVDSPEYARRDQLLREFGEHWPVTVRFVVQPEDLLPDARVLMASGRDRWRARSRSTGATAPRDRRLV